MAKKQSTTRELRTRLWDIVFERAKGLDGRAVAEAFQDASQDVWDGGLDEAWEKLKQPSTECAKQAFDIAWIVATSRRLGELRKGKSAKKK